MPLDRKDLEALLSRIDANLEISGTICLIGSGATILLGQSARQTDDIDVWARASRMALAKIRWAVEAAGFGFNPTEELRNVPYLQIVHPGVVHVPGWNATRREWMGEPEREVWKGERLTVTVPSAPVLIASKLVRGDDRDLEDCLWLMAAQRVASHDVVKAIRRMPKAPRDTAADNFSFLAMMEL